jgi:hypothetical protein
MREPNALVSSGALARELGNSNLRVYDCTTYLEPPPPGSDDPYIAVLGRSTSRRAAPTTALASAALVEASNLSLVITISLV